MSLLGYWKLNDGPSTEPANATDLSGHANNHDGTYYFSGTNYTYGALIVGGVHGRHLFSYNYGHVISPFNNESDLILSGEMAIACWVRRSRDDTIFDFVAAGEAGSTQANNHQFCLTANASNTVQLWWEHGSGTLVTANSTVGILRGATEYDHIAAVRSLNGGGPNLNVNFYVNGVAAGLHSDLAPPDGGGSAKFFIGRDGNGANGYSQFLSSVRVWDNVGGLPDSAEILSIYNTEKASMDQLSKNEISIEIDQLSLPNYKAVIMGPNSPRATL